MSYDILKQTTASQSTMKGGVNFWIPNRTSLHVH